MTKGPPRHTETWWWNRDVENVVAKRKVCHKAWRKSKSAEDKHTLDVARKEVDTVYICFTKQFTNTVKHATHKTNRHINRATHNIQGYNITLTTSQVQEAVKITIHKVLTN